MYDIRAVRDDPAAFDEALRRRKMDPASAGLIALDDERRAVIARLQDAQTRRNTASKAIGKAKATKDEAEAQRLIDEVAHLKAEIQSGEEAERAVSQKLETALAGFPNTPLAEVPDGVDESDNVELRRVGEPPKFDFAPKEHDALGEALGLMDVGKAAAIAGARFTILTGKLARLERALGQFMIDLHTGEHGYTEVSPPLLVRDEAVFGTNQLPKFAEDLFRTTDGRWLIPTAEVPLTNLVREEILDASALPMRVTALTPCFRSEAGSAGRDTRGMLRQHQFSKCEMVSITTPETALDEHERMTACAEAVLKALGLAYRVVTLSTGDLGFGARRTYDLEVWLPGQDTYREISSVSVCGDFQARRMNARYRPQADAAPRFVHTLNGSGVAVGRALIAVMENYQDADGSIRVPDVLVPYTGFDRIAA
ncbi:serine--tRNA ligase [Acuticoccus sp. MNP-M23]|uniref:serine--tRNA ligase n=1 Tax=Acuticoccus sp. MNP-M23 TaxID=3072793 RepID=UPI0028159E9F|nr:serine--tRNA ligase [Acuticoccus sp. MNP-M23]WMS42413.1 serine--tRNA ligase [Acuticoccus sp. MNP-M23]